MTYDLFLCPSCLLTRERFNNDFSTTVPTASAVDEVSVKVTGVGAKKVVQLHHEMQLLVNKVVIAKSMAMKQMLSTPTTRMSGTIVRVEELIMKLKRS
jgi:hypothetical protein